MVKVATRDDVRDKLSGIGRQGADVTDLGTPEGELVGRVIAMPADTNPEGDIFGGWLLAQMDIAGATPAFALAHGRCATVAVDAMVFHQPVSVGDEVSIYARVVRAGRTSIRVHVEAWKRPRYAEHVIRVTEGVFTYVAIGPDGKPRPLPGQPAA